MITNTEERYIPTAVVSGELESVTYMDLPWRESGRREQGSRRHNDSFVVVTMCDASNY
ncbi:hypothetical protein J6590_016454 [Homalodisca vitripennis]|nr:hypothetical protein J6590_016454 [Homalodisca vitripennis]